MPLITELLAEFRLLGPGLGLIAGAVGFAALHHLLIGLRRPDDRTHLLFAALCTTVAVWIATGLIRYSTADVQVLVETFRVRQILGNVIGALLIWFLASFTEIRPRGVLWALTGLHAAAAVAEILLPLGTSFAVEPSLNFITLPWNEVLTDAATGGPWRRVVRFLPALDFGFGFYVAIRAGLAGRMRRAVPTLVALAALAAGVMDVYELLLGPVPSAELAFLGLVLVMSLATSDRVAEASVMQGALKESEQRLRTLVETAPEAVLLLDAESGAAREGNEKALELFGLGRGELAGTTPATLSPPEQLDGTPSVLVFERRVREARSGGRPVFRWVVRTPDGEDIPCEAQVVRLPGSDPAMLRLSLVDLRELEAAEARQDELEAQLIQAQRLEAVGRLTGGVAHDFNNLLTVVQGNLELLLEEDVARDEEERSLLEESLRATRTGSELTRRLLAFSRRQALAPRAVDLSELVADLVGLLKRTLGDAVVIEATVADDLHPLVVDPVQLESALVNLAINARDAMPGGGRLTIRAENYVLHRDDPGWSEELTEGAFVLITVADTGTGMDGETLARATDPFYTTKEVGKGSGLGLSMVHGFVAQSGGGMRIDSTPGSGTEISLLFPVAA